MITNDKRAFRRTKKKFTVKYALFSSLDDVHESESKNISMGGVFFESLRSFSIGEVLMCSILSEEMVSESEWKARVVRCEELKEHMIKTFGVAVEFIKPINDADKALKKILPKQ